MAMLRYYHDRAGFHVRDYFYENRMAIVNSIDRLQRLGQGWMPHFPPVMIRGFK
jgi:hypothetical protein